MGYEVVRDDESENVDTDSGGEFFFVWAAVGYGGDSREIRV